jgi:lipopolysaccharide/colanic/teichoic acid biosynthesis glycosyltransferase
LFRQERVGLLGRPFTCLKFRTMQANAVTTGHQGYLQTLMNSNEPMTKMDLMGDARLIRGGSILRATGLDELPQLINVLRGEMSIVGPRPCVPYEYANYLPWQKRRFDCVPGLTGLWQVSGKNKTTFNQMIEMDIKYAQKKSLGFDLWIMVRTIPAIIGQLVEMIAKRARSATVTESTAKR